MATAEQTLELETILSNMRRSFIRGILWIIIMGIIVIFVDAIKRILLSFPEVTHIGILLGEYQSYINAIIVVLLGYKVIKNFGETVYWSTRRFTDHPTAASMRTIVRIIGIGVLLSVLTSVFNVNPSAAITLGSFIGLVVGFATQTILGHVVAGIFLAITRPFKVGDYIKVAGKEGYVSEIGIMHTILTGQDKDQAILIPSGKIVTDIIIKSKPK